MIKVMMVWALLLWVMLTTPYANADKILLLGDNHMSGTKMKMLKASAKTYDIEFDHRPSSEITKEKAANLFSDYQLVILDALNPVIAGMTFPKFQSAISKNNTVMFEPVRMPSGSPFRQGVSSKDASVIADYYHNGGRHNFDNMMAYIDHHLFNNKKTVYKMAHKIPENALYHKNFPGRYTNNKSDFKQWLSISEHQPVIAIAMHRSELESEDTTNVDHIISEIESKGGKAFGYFFKDVKENQITPENEFNYLGLLSDSSQKTWVNVIINMRMIHYMDKRKQDFNALGVPVIHTLAYYDGDQIAYEKDHAGISANMAPYFLMIPETSGIIDPVIISAKSSDGDVQRLIDYQIDGLVARALNQARLANKNNADKKVAIMIWNYPPGEKNMGAAFLNVPLSLKNITNEMIDAGYLADKKEEGFFIENAGGLLAPLYRTGQVAALEKKDLTGYLKLSDYKIWFSGLPESVQTKINRHWGPVEQQAFLRDINGQSHFMIPRMKNGNIITLPQPSFGSSDEERETMYHDSASPVGHYYLAVYLYVKQTFGADAIVHLGTHGSQEWLLGKEIGLSKWDSPNLAVGDVPVIYPFIMDNVGEAMQAKRRGRATMISHLTPGFAAAGAYADIAEVTELIHEYESLSEGESKNKTAKQIQSKFTEMNVQQDLSLAEDIPFEELLEVAHDYLHELAEEAQPLGLHTFGVTPKDAHILTTTQQMLTRNQVKLMHDFEVKQKLTLPGQVEDALYSEDIEAHQGTQLMNIPGFKFLWHLLINENDSASDVSDFTDPLSEDLKQVAVTSRDYFNDFKSQQEIPMLLTALNAGFIDVAPGGDPIRNPDAMPTGKNMIGFNPTKVPTKAAYETGKELVEDSIYKFHAENGHYPDKLAFSLWSLETMRHHGVLESQVMAAMGIRPTWSQSGRVTGTEIISYAELKRPRVDVVISATGLYRDAFPNVMLLLAKGIQQISELKEEGNSIYRNSQALYKDLVEQGKTPEDAGYLSSVRIFSNETGVYGTGLAGASLASDTWETDEKLSNMYLSRMGYAFGADENRWSENTTASDLYSKSLSGTDAVIFSRSSNLYGMITSDDPFQYFGGISLAIRNIDGKSPQMYISNLRKPQSASNETLQKFMGRELRTRAFHPRWIEQMQKEGYSGALTVLDRVNNFWGWNVVDPNSVSNDQWQEFADIYVKDKYDMQMSEFFNKNNPYALAQIVERMLEAQRKDYFETDEETLKQLTQTYLELANSKDIYTENEKFKQHLSQLAKGFGLEFKLPEKSVEEINTEAVNAPASESAKEQVEGQQLQKVDEMQEQPLNKELYYIFGLLLLIWLAGIIWQWSDKSFIKHREPQA